MSIVIVAAYSTTITINKLQATSKHRVTAKFTKQKFVWKPFSISITINSIFSSII